VAAMVVDGRVGQTLEEVVCPPFRRNCWYHRCGTLILFRIFRTAHKKQAPHEPSQLFLFSRSPLGVPCHQQQSLRLGCNEEHGAWESVRKPVMSGTHKSSLNCEDGLRRGFKNLSQALLLTKKNRIFTWDPIFQWLFLGKSDKESPFQKLISQFCKYVLNFWRNH
jgi:hypothetical protein